MSQSVDNLLEGGALNMPEVSPSADSISNKALEIKAVENAEKQEKSDKKKRGPYKKTGKPGNTSIQAASPNQSRLGGPADQGQRDNARRIEDRRHTANFCVGVIEQTGGMLAGEVARMSDLEKEGLAANFERYLEAKNIADLPPGVALALGLSGYYSRIIVAPTAQPKIEKFAMWMRNKFRGIKNARINRRNDNERKNDTGETVDPDLSKK